LGVSLEGSCFNREIVQLIDEILVGGLPKAEHLEERCGGGHGIALIGADRVFEPLENGIESAISV